MNINDVDNVLKIQDKAFSEVIYFLTEQGIPAGQRVTRIATAKASASKIVSDVIAFKKVVTDPASIQKIDAFVREKTVAFQAQIDNIIGLVDNNAEYARETFKETTKASMPGALLNNTASSVAQHDSNVQALPFTPKRTVEMPPEEKIPDFTVPTASSVVTVGRAALLNFSLDINTIDGEEIPATATECFFVISPYTADSRIQITRFVLPESVTEYIHQNYRGDLVQPMIIKGVPAQVRYTVNLEV